MFEYDTNELLWRYGSKIVMNVDGELEQSDFAYEGYQ